MEKHSEESVVDAMILKSFFSHSICFEKIKGYFIEIEFKFPSKDPNWLLVHRGTYSFKELSLSKIEIIRCELECIRRDSHNKLDEVGNPGFLPVSKINKMIREYKIEFNFPYNGEYSGIYRGDKIFNRMEELIEKLKNLPYGEFNV